MTESLDERLTNPRQPGDPGYDAFYDATDDQLAVMVPSPPVSPEEQYDRTSGPIHSYFGLTYSNYLVLHRSLMQSMPVEWQERIVGCLLELQRAFDHVKQADVYDVTAAQEREYGDLSDGEMAQLGITRPEEPAGDYDDTWERRYYDQDGNEHEAHERVLVPLLGADPVPHYNRGRTFIEPRTADASAVA